MKNIYLCGQSTNPKLKNWREEIKSELLLTDFTSIDRVREDYKTYDEDCINEIVHLSKKDIENCDVIIAYCSIPSIETSMEIFFAWSINIPVVCVVPYNSPVFPVSPWLKYHSTKIVRDIDTALEWVKENI